VILAAAAKVRPLDQIAAICFIDIAIIMVVARLAGAAFKKIHQPAVVGEIVAGILLGPTLLGAFPGHLPNHIFPTDARPYLNVLAQLGLIIFMFIVGLEVDAKLMKGRARLAASVSLSSIALPFALGIAIAFALHGSHHLVADPHHPTVLKNVKLLPFALFIGASMSVTAFPVLARILAERGMYRTPLGAVTLACAAVDDVAAWTLLAVVLAIVSSSSLIPDLPRILIETAAFFAVMMLVVRPRLRQVVNHYRAKGGGVTPELMAVILVGILVSSFVTSKIGIHSIFGAFLFGIAMPKDNVGSFVHEVLERLESVAVLLLLPIFFIITGFDVNVRTIGVKGLGQLGLILVAAIAGKFIGATAAARVNGLPWRRASAIGTLMNTRGLTELVILNVGLAFGVLDHELFTLLVVMAVVTTMMTEPLLRLVYPNKLLDADIAEVERAGTGPASYLVLALVDDLDRDTPLVDLAADLAASSPGGRVVLSHFVPRRPDRGLGSGMAGELVEVANTRDRLEALCRQRPDVAMSPAALATDDIPRDLIAQADRLEATVKVIVMARPAGSVASRLRADTTYDLVFFDGDGSGRAGPVIAEVADDRDASAVAEVAVRLAASRHVALRLVAADGRRSRRVHQVAERVGGIAHIPSVTVTDSTPLETVAGNGALGLIVAGATSHNQPDRTAPDVPVVVVHSGEDPARIGWDERLGRLASLVPPAATEV
jgi:Kef-type K+ transport system membrane component KefB